MKCLKLTKSVTISTILKKLFGYPYNNDLVICKDGPDYLGWLILIDWRQCGNSLALCYFAVVMELPDTLWMNC